MLKRPPVVVVMGHVDHGKTTLLDTIRKTNIAAREAGGITQAVGAYEIEHQGNKITFIDTPGHEAFGKMRRRGAKVADLAVLVVAADDGVKPQTKDALEKIREAKIPFIVAINKIDKPNADIEKTKNDLMQNEVYLEGFGGDISFQNISAKQDQGIEELLDLIILATDVLNLTYEKEAPASGVILTAYKDPKRGNIVSAILKNGTLKNKLYIKTQSANGRIKILENFLSKAANELTPSAPAIILGFETLPNIGDEFIAEEKPIEELKLSSSAKSNLQVVTTKNDTSIHILVKAPEAGSLEAVCDYVKSISTSELPYRVIDASVGDVQQADAKLAETTKSIILNFGSNIDKAAETIIEAKNIPILTKNIIYELDQELKNFIIQKIMKVPATFDILALFNEKKGGERVIGGKLSGSPVKTGEIFKIINKEDQIIGEGKVLGIKSLKQSLTEAKPGNEYGFFISSTTPTDIGYKLLFNEKEKEAKSER